MELELVGPRREDAAQQDIQRGEESWLGFLSANDLRVLLHALRRLTTP
jgi:hypothetical protein